MNKYSVHLVDAKYVQELKQILKHKKIEIKTELKLAPVFVICASYEQVEQLKTLKSGKEEIVKKVERIQELWKY